MEVGKGGDGDTCNSVNNKNKVKITRKSVFKSRTLEEGELCPLAQSQALLKDKKLGLFPFFLKLCLSLPSSRFQSRE